MRSRSTPTWPVRRVGGSLSISHSVTINGLGADVLTISGNGESQIFTEAGGGPQITIRDLTLADGHGPTGSSGGGALFMNGGTITLERVLMRNNNSEGNSGSTIVAAFATFDIKECAIVDNLNIGVGAVRLQDCQTTITSTTISNNQTRGISFFNTDATPDSLSLTNVTITGNSGDGIEMLVAAGTTAAFEYQNTIFADNGNDNIDARVNGDPMLITGDEISITSLGNNILADTPVGDAAHAAAGGDLRDTDPLLAPLGDFGGTTPTSPPLPGSPAIDSGAVVAGITNDQRGFPIVGTPDIGAAEDQTIIPDQTDAVLKTRLAQKLKKFKKKLKKAKKKRQLAKVKKFKKKVKKLKRQIRTL